MRGTSHGPIRIGVGVFLLYLLTAARHPQPGDGLEFLAAAGCRGVPHPPGYPTFTFLCSLAGAGPGMYARAVRLCCLYSAVAAALLGTLARNLTGSARLGLLVGLGSALSLALWDSATIIEVYGFAAMLSAGALVALLPGPNIGEAVSGRRILAAALLQGVAATNHLPSLSLLPLLAYRAFQARRLPMAMGGMAAGLLPLLLLPLWASASPPINWGDPDTLHGFLWMISGGDYKSTRFFQLIPGTWFTPGTYAAFLVTRAADLLMILGGQVLGGNPGWWGTYRLARLNELAGGGPFRPLADVQLFPELVGILIAAITAWGVRRAWQRSRLATGMLLACPLAQLGFICTYNILDITDYVLGVLVGASPLLVLGLEGLAAMVMPRLRARGRLLGQPLLYLVLLAVFLFLSNFREADRSQKAPLREELEGLVERLPRGSLLLTQGDADTYAAWYLRHAERRDLPFSVLATNFCQYPWYIDGLKASDPTLRDFPLKPAPLSTLEGFVARLEEEIIRPGLKRGRVFITDQDLNVVALLGQRWRFAPPVAIVPESAVARAQENGVVLVSHVVEVLPGPAP